MENWCFVAILCLLFGKGETFPNSAPIASCIDLVPGHIPPTNEFVVNPFVIDLQTGGYSANGVLEVTIQGLNGVADFKGLLLQARAVNTQTIVGTWETPTTSGLTTLSCSNTNDAITHSDNTIKSTPVQLRWNAPALDVGPVHFVATLVKQYDIFWVAISSAQVFPAGTPLCDTNYCRNEGTCSTTPTGVTYCKCPFGFTGQFCEIVPGSFSACEPDPCQNNGQCQSDTGECACATNNFGDICQFNVQIKVLCPINICQNGGRCLVDQATGEYCACRVGFEGSTCDMSVAVDPCVPDPCLNEGVCVNEAGSYRCLCPPTIGGNNCEIGANPCDVANCLNGGQCVIDSSTLLGYRCTCPRTHTGSQCETSVCSTNPCRNGGTCDLVANVVSGYSCRCTSFFTGTTCQTLVSTDGPCGPTTCGSGSCVADATADNGVKCNCPSTHSGLSCQFSVCDTSPCLNGGLCVLDSSLAEGHFCDCPVTYTGDNCETQVGCLPNPCLNGGACSENPESDGYICDCPSTHVGVRCQTVNPCISGPCFNNGECELINNPDPGFQCNCVGGYSGAGCQTPPDICFPNPCINGQCTPNPIGVAGFTCNCFGDYIGPTCDTLPPTPGVTVEPGMICVPNPCLNDGECNPDSTSPSGFTCTCKEAFFGQMCESKFAPCVLNNPCENNGQCIDEDLSCQCTPQYRGSVCHFPVSANCSEGIIELCIHGDCVDDAASGYRCDCVEGATGLNCEDKDPCIPAPCGPQGTCREVGNGDYVCDCESGFNGEKCENKQSGTVANFLELVFTYWPVALGILVAIIIVIICWIGCHFTREENKKKAIAAGKVAAKQNPKAKKSKRRGSEDSELGIVTKEEKGKKGKEKKGKEKKGKEKKGKEKKGKESKQESEESDDPELAGTYQI